MDAPSESKQTTTARYEPDKTRRPTGAAYIHNRSPPNPDIHVVHQLRPRTSAARSTVSSYQASYHSGSPSEIMGDFVLINSPDRTATPVAAPMQQSRATFGDTAYQSRRTKQPRHPYQFEPPSPDEVETWNFKERRSQDDDPSPRRLHVKNARSDDHTMFNAPPDIDRLVTPFRSIGRIHRSESSPSLLPAQFLPRRDKTPSTELSAGYRYHNPQQSASESLHSYGETQNTYSPPHNHLQGYADSVHPRSRSPSRQQYQVQESAPLQQSHRSPPRSPTKTLDDVSEGSETVSIFLEHAYPSSPPKKRSRSPMKKMFGEHGWLGQSPDEKPEENLRYKNSSTVRIAGSSHQHRKKTSMMGKLKNKLEEFAEKADLTPTKSSRSERERHPKLSMLAVSLGPPEQARMYMEIELMIVHTANCFLMTQFSQGRIAVDSIKKTVDMWKSKGRPIVIEFMYDQATQRELVAANQHNFRFHGGRAGDELRVNAMLYNWKQVASVMCVRTFCTADTILLKLLFDIEQILELLGAGEPMLLRLQQIRTSANEAMRITRHNKEVEAIGQSLPRGREMAWNAHSSTGSGSQSESMIDQYGGLKLVPDSYKEKGSWHQGPTRESF